jgi:hypothetical protein
VDFLIKFYKSKVGEIEMETMENDIRRQPRFSKKMQLLLAAGVALILLMVLISIAWFYYQRGLQTMTKVHAPVKLYIAAGHQEDVANFYLGDIDVTQSTSKDYVFCVYGEPADDYILQLAHTTNIPFTYTIYKATESENETADTAVTYVSEEDNKTYYYKKKNATDTWTGESIQPVQGAYLNLDVATNLATNQYHKDTYGDYAVVQDNAEPLYWQGTITEPLNDTDEDLPDNTFCNYYILTVSWEEGTVENDKETDIVYITAGLNDET